MTLDYFIFHFCFYGPKKQFSKSYQTPVLGDESHSLRVKKKKTDKKWKIDENYKTVHFEVVNLLVQPKTRRNDLKREQYCTTVTEREEKTCTRVHFTYETRNFLCNTKKYNKKISFYSTLLL